MISPPLLLAGALALLARAWAAPAQAPFAANAPEVLRAGFSSRGAGIPVLHDLCSAHALVTSAFASAARVYVYHSAERGFCVTLFSPDAGARLALAISDPAQQQQPRTPAYDSAFDWDGEGGSEENGDGKDGERDEASWHGRGVMPGSLRLRGQGDCVHVRATVDGAETTFETCLNRRQES